MVKKGIEESNQKPLLKDVVSSSGWALCIGAGTSLPVFPSWKELVVKLIKLSSNKNDKIFCDYLINSFSPDTLIQASQIILDKSEKDYSEILSNELYSNILTKATKSEWKSVAKVFHNSNPSSLGKKDWEIFLNFAQTQFNSTTAFQIAEVINDSLSTNLKPSAIISFNAEPLLLSLLNALQWGKARKQSSTFSKGQLKINFDRITRSISTRSVSRIPYIFCHGLLPIPGMKNKEVNYSSDKLVFSENEYLQLANNSFSWQSSMFLDISSTRKVVFIGVSLTDSNMRRWLSWIHKNKINELKELNKYQGYSTSHFWINLEPDTDDTKRWIEASVAHLGVRLIWIKSYNNVGKVLRTLLSL